MKKCPYCAEEIKDDAVVCRHCTRELPKHKSFKPSKTSPAVWGCLTILVVGVILAIALSSGSDNESKTITPIEKSSNQEQGATQEVSADKPLEYKLAVINANGFVKEDDTTVNRFRYLLDNIEANTDITRQEIADMTIAGWQALQGQYGKETTLLEFMEETNKSVSKESRDLGIDYAEIVSIVVTLMGK